MRPVGISVEALRDWIDRAVPLRLLDVRRAAARAADPVRIGSAQWQDPDAVAEWAAALDDRGPVVVYCVHGHEVGQNAALVLAARGFDARYLEGGIEGWKQAGLPVMQEDAS